MYLTKRQEQSVSYDRLIGKYDLNRKTFRAMSTKENIYGLLGPKKLNPNLIVLGAVLVIVTVILVYSGRHNKIKVTKAVSIETNIPAGDSSENQE